VGVWIMVPAMCPVAASTNLGHPSS
jgi:hypothetical protein